MLSLLFNKVKLYLLGLFGIVVAFYVVYLKGKNNQKVEDKIEDLENYKETREKIDEAPSFDDVLAATEFLRNRKRK